MWYFNDFFIRNKFFGKQHIFSWECETFLMLFLIQFFPSRRRKDLNNKNNKIHNVIPSCYEFSCFCKFTELSFFVSVRKEISFFFLNMNITPFNAAFHICSLIFSIFILFFESNFYLILTLFSYSSKMIFSFSEEWVLK